MPAKLPPNIERSKNRRGEFIGHSRRGPQRIVREGNWWRSVGPINPGGKPVYALTRNLTEMGEKMEKAA